MAEDGNMLICFHYMVVVSAVHLLLPQDQWWCIYGKLMMLHLTYDLP